MGSTSWKKQAEDAAIVNWSDVEELANASVTVEVEGEERDFSFHDAVRLRNDLVTAQKEMEIQIKIINDQLLLLLNAADKDKVRLWDGFRLERRAGSSPAKIEPTKLLEAGVTLDQIQAATVPGKPYQYVMVTKEKA